jgi:hypothetical protein
MSSRAAKREIMRRLRLGDLRKLLRARCGHTLPDDDAGREYLWELLLPVSLAPEEHERKMANTVEIWAPWLGKDEAEQLIDQINRMPARERMPKARIVGERLRLTNEERECLRLWAIAPFDMTNAQLMEQRKTKDRVRQRQRRRLAGRKPRTASVARVKPWAIRGMSRATWYRKHRGIGHVPEAGSLEEKADTLCASETGMPV